MKGFFISIEGTDGAGKTTQMKRMNEYLSELGYTVVLTREPGGTDIGEKIRRILLDEKNTSLCDRTEILLYAAARAQHLEEKIVPSINDGEIVLCDRFSDSSVAYQGFGRGLPFEILDSINSICTNGIEPDMTLFLDISPAKALERKKCEENHVLDRMELEELDFHNLVYQGFVGISEKYPKRVKRINADCKEEEVFAKIKDELDRLISKIST